MTALAEALLAAQRQAIGAASKAFVSGSLNETDLFELLDDIGARDTVEQAQLLASLHALQRFGAQAPQARAPRTPDPITPSQIGGIKKRSSERNWPLPDFNTLTKDTASKMISEMDAGTYDPDSWSVPF